MKKNGKNRKMLRSKTEKLNFLIAGMKLDRKSVVQGKSVAPSVDLGGRRIIKKSFFQAEDGIRDVKA